MIWVCFVEKRRLQTEFLRNGRRWSDGRMVKVV